MNDSPVPAPRRRHMRWAAIAILAIAAGGAVGLWARGRASAPDRLREKIEAAVAANHWEQAATLSRRLTELQPCDGNAWMTRARAASALGDLSGSALMLSQVPADNEQKMRALRRLTELQLGPLNAPLAAEQTLREILEREPSSEFAHQRLIFYYALTLERQKLVRQARQALELGCEPIEAYVYLFFTDSLHFSNGPALNQRWLSGTPNSPLFRVAAAIQIATTLEGGPLRDDLSEVQQFRKMADRREQVLTSLFERYPRNLELLAWNIEHLIRQGDLDGVVHLLARLPPEADDDNRFQRFAGWAEARLGHDAEALACYNQALKLHPLDWNTRHLIAELRRRQLKFDEVSRLEGLVQSADELRRALDTSPDAKTVAPEVLTRLAEYAESCGDELFAKSLRRRLSEGLDARRAGPAESFDE